MCSYRNINEHILFIWICFVQLHIINNTDYMKIYSNLNVYKYIHSSYYKFKTLVFGMCLWEYFIFVNLYILYEVKIYKTVK